LLAARIASETNPQDPIARAKVKHFENEVAQLQVTYNTLVAPAPAPAPAPTQGTLLMERLILESAVDDTLGWQELTAILLRHTLTGAPTTLTARKEDFKKNLKDAYLCHGGKKKWDKTRCMLLNCNLPSAIVTAAHIFRRSNEHIAQYLLGIENIDDVKNGLLLFKPLEKAFDKFQIGFVYNDSDDSFRMKIFNNNCEFRNLLLIDFILPSVVLNDMKLDLTALPTGWRKSKIPVLAPGTNYNLLTKFSDLEGACLSFKNINRPYKRCLNLQARIAHTEAIKNNTMEPPDYVFKDYWSEGLTVDEKLDPYFRSMDGLDTRDRQI
jgi:hypothetical protein